MKRNNSGTFAILVTALFVMFALSPSTALAQQDDTSAIYNGTSTTIILVRHAEKAEGDDPGLTDEGKERALRLKELLKNAGISTIYSTDYNRTKETVQPLADLLNLKVELYKPFDEDHYNTMLSGNKGKVVLMSGHSNTTPGYANKLLGRGAFKQAFTEDEYGHILVVTLPENGTPSMIKLAY